MTASPKILAALQKLSDAQAQRQAQSQLSQERKRELEKTIKELGFIQEEQDPVFESSPAANLSEDDVSIIKNLPLALALVRKSVGPKGEDGISIKGDQGEVGPMGPAGKDGKNGESIIGPKGDPGKDAEVDTAELRKLAEAPLKKHERENDHKLLHSSFVLAGKNVSIEGLEDKDILEYDKSKDEFRFVKAKKEVAQVFSGGSTTNGRYRMRTVTSSYAVDPLDDVVLVDASSGNVTLTLHPSAGNEGSHHYIKRIDSVTDNTVLFVLSGSDTLDFETVYQLVNQGSGAEIFADGSTSWFIKHS